MTEPSPSSRPVGLLAELPKAVLDHLLDAATAHTFEPDSTILQEGGPSGDCFLVQSGSVQVLTVRSDGSRVILARLGPGELFGEQAMLAGPQGRRSATVRAVETTRVLQIPQQHMLETLRALPTLHRRWVRLGQEQRQFNEAHRAEIMDDLVTLTENTDEFPIHTYEAGQVILERGAPSDAFYLLAAGRVEVRRSGRVLARLKAGDFFGILGILNQTPRYATIIALDAVTAVEFQPSAIQEPVTPALKRHLERRMRVYSLPSGAVLKQSTLEQDDRHWVESIRSQRDGQYVRSLYDPQTGDVLCGLAADPDISLAVNILKYQSHALDMHRKVWLDEDARIVGAEARGGWSQLPQVLDAILNETTIDRADVEQFPRSGELALDLGTDAAMVCVCMQVRRDTIMTCIQGGAEDPETLMQTLGCEPTPNRRWRARSAGLPRMC